MFRNSSGDSTSILPVISFFKALGMNDEAILNIFDKNPYITQSLNNEDYNRSHILKDPQIVNLLIRDTKDSVAEGRARTIDLKLKNMIYHSKKYIDTDDTLIV